MTATVTGLTFTPVKGTRLQPSERLTLGRAGAEGNRAFYVIDDRDRMINAKGVGGLQTIVSELDDGVLRLRFPDGRVVEDEWRDGEQIETRFFSHPRSDRLVEGPFSSALSDHLERQVRLVRAVAAAGAVDRGAAGGVSLISRASLEGLAGEAEVPGVDVRRFRMLVEIDGVPAHAEDAWVGRDVRIGAALVRLNGHVGRCLITSRDPETGEVDLPTLDILAGYRGNVEATEPLPFGVYGEVREPAVIALGDEVQLV